MADAKITLNTLFGLPNKTFALEALAVGIKEDELSALKGRILAMAAGLQWSTVEDEIVNGFSNLLETDVMDVIVKSWQKYGVLADSADKSKATGQAETVDLVDHTAKLTLTPYLEIEIAGVSKQIPLDVSVEITLKGLRLSIEDGHIRSVRTGTCEGEGEIKIETLTVLKKPFGPIELPGRVKLGNGIPLV
jgi:hypothetical protein